jgi:hypothetical protein
MTRQIHFKRERHFARGTEKKDRRWAVLMAAYPFVLLAAIAVSGCVAAKAGQGSTAASQAALPTGSRLSAAGYLTIGEVPPSPFPEEPPPEPQLVDDLARRTSSPDPAVRAKAWEEANGSPAFQAELQRLRQILGREEPTNFIEVRLVRDPAVAAEIWFKRDAPARLARYTSNPRFRPRQGGLSPAEQERLRSVWAERMEGGELINMLSIDPFSGVVELGIAVEETEFRRVAAERGWELGPQLKLNFPPPRPAAFVQAPLKSHVRVFARETKAKGIQLLAGHSGRIVLGDGCFRLEHRKAGELGPLVLFGRETRLGLDEQNYLVVLSDSGRRRYRVGERGIWPGPNAVDENDPDVRALRRECGSEPVVNVAEPQGERLFSTPDPGWVADYARARSLSYRQAWQEVIACMKRETGRGRRGLAVRERCIRQFN